MGDTPKTLDAFDALANPLRRQLLMALRAGPRSASELARDMPIGRPAVSEHLQALRAAGLARVERRGRERYYHMDPRPLAEVGAWLNAMLVNWTGVSTTSTRSIPKGNGDEAQAKLVAQPFVPSPPI